MVVEVALYHAPQPASLIRHGLVSHPIEPLADFFYLTPQTLGYGLPLHHESSALEALRTYMCETQEVERFRFPFASALPIPYRQTAKFDQAGLLRVHLQPKALHAPFQLPLESLCIAAVLKPHDKVICVTHDDDLACGVALSPLLHPQVQNIVQVYIRQ